MLTNHQLMTAFSQLIHVQLNAGVLCKPTQQIFPAFEVFILAGVVPDGIVSTPAKLLLTPFLPKQRTF